MDCVAEIKIKSIKYVGKQDVYNMEVEKHHNFAIEDGLIVHNCLDSLRYALETLINTQQGTFFK